MPSLLLLQGAFRVLLFPPLLFEEAIEAQINSAAGDGQERNIRQTSNRSQSRGRTMANVHESHGEG